MKKRYQTKKGVCSAIAFCLLLVAFNSGCKKFLDIPAPNTQQVTSTVFNNYASATSAQVYIYTQMAGGESYNMARSMGLYSDELTNYATDNIDAQLYTNSLQALSNPGPWNTTAYKYIYDANAVIDGLATTSGCSAAVKGQLTGEALFIRAFWHFYLTNIYGDVPLVLTTNSIVNESSARSPRKLVLQQVVADLEQAKDLLNANYVTAADTVTTTERVRPNKAAALALLARAWLYLGDYDGANAQDYVKADSAASAVIANSNYSLVPLNNVFLENSSEAIWQLETPSNATSDTPDGLNFILTSAPASGRSQTALSTQLVSTFESGDQRLVNWVGTFTSGTATYYYPFKYKQIAYENQEFTMVLRLGEQYLIRAEAEAHESKIADAQADLNSIRTRAGLPNTTAATPSDLLTAVLHERQVELFTEWGSRWFDLCRAVSAKLPVNANTVMGAPGNACQSKGGAWSSTGYQLLFPVPLTQILDNKNLTQNPGY